jgi:CAAX protease family protein
MRRVISAFWNRDERRLRAGWRLPIQLISFVVAALAAQGVVVVTAGKGTPLGGVLMAVLYLAFEAGAGWLVARFIDRRAFADFGYHINRRWWLDFAFGLVLGALMLSGIFLVEWLAGWVTVSAGALPKSGLPLAPAVGIAILFYIAIGFVEEFVFRGYEIRNLAEGLVGRRLSPRAAIATAWLISAIVFGLAHAMNKEATAVSTINIMLTAGGLLGLAYVLTGELAISVGIHITWNMFQGTVYGFPVSGNPVEPTLFHIEQSGPTLWTGGAFGPEAGLLCTISCTMALVLVAVWVRARSGKLRFDTDVANYTPRVRRVASAIIEERSATQGQLPPPEVTATARVFEGPQTASLNATGSDAGMRPE